MQEVGSLTRGTVAPQVHHLRGNYGAALACALRQSPAAAFAYADVALQGGRGSPRVPPARAPALWAALVAAMGALVQVLGLPNLARSFSSGIF